MIGLFDGDEAIFKAAVIKQETINWDDEDGEATTAPPTLKQAKRTLVNLVDAWLAAANCDDITFVISPPERGLFRRGFAADYKNGRAPKPEHYAELEAWAIKRWSAVWYPGLEADDTMGILAGKGKTIISSDKDMKTVPGRLHVPKSGKTMTITPDRADHWWMMQTLMGDSTDGFAGCVGCGPTGAENVLLGGASMRDWWPLVEDKFAAQKTGKYRLITQTRADALQQAKLSRILRPGEFDKDSGGVQYRVGHHKVSFNAYALAR